MIRVRRKSINAFESLNILYEECFFDLGNAGKPFILLINSPERCRMKIDFVEIVDSLTHLFN